MNPGIDIPELLPDGWTCVPVEGNGLLFLAVAPDDGGYRSGFSLAAGPAGPGGEVLAPEAAHEEQLQVAWLQMTDALLVDHRSENVGGCASLVSTIAFRQGPWTLTAMICTIAGPLGPLVAAGICDADRCSVDGPLFDRLVSAIAFVETVAG